MGEIVAGLPPGAGAWLQGPLRHVDFPFPSLMWGLDTLLQYKRETALSKGLPLPWMLIDPVPDP